MWCGKREHAYVDASHVRAAQCSRMRERVRGWVQACTSTERGTGMWGVRSLGLRPKILLRVTATPQPLRCYCPTPSLPSVRYSRSFRRSQALKAAGAGAELGFA
eukprot:2392082-Rhodomonas_salina.1